MFFGTVPKPWWSSSDSVDGSQLCSNKLLETVLPVDHSECDKNNSSFRPCSLALGIRTVYVTGNCDSGKESTRRLATTSGRSAYMIERAPVRRRLGLAELVSAQQGLLRFHKQQLQIPHTSDASALFIPVVLCLQASNIQTPAVLGNQMDTPHH